MKKAVLFLLCLLAYLQLSAAVGHGHIGIHRMNGQVDSIAVDGIYSITHSKEDLFGRIQKDYVTMVVETENEMRRYLISDVARVELIGPGPWEPLTITGGMGEQSNNGARRIYFNGTFPRKDDSKIIYRWEYRDSVYIHIDGDDNQYKTKLDSMNADSTYAWFETVRVEEKKSPIYVYYPGQNATAYNKVTIAQVQRQDVVDNSKHIGISGDCATAEAVETDDQSVYTFNLRHHPAFFAFLAHSDRLPSVKLKKVTMVADKPITGTFTFDHENRIDLNSVENPGYSITLETPFFYDDGWKHTPRNYQNSQDSTAAYMVVAPQKDVHFKFYFNVEDTLSLIDTTYVKEYYMKELKPNTFYTVNASVPDTLFSIVDLGLGDIKYAFRNVEAYFERGPVSNYGGAFAYGESNTKNDYGPGYHNENYRGGLIKSEFTKDFDAPYQRWGGKWRLPLTSEIDTLLKYCKTEWWEYNGVEGALVTGPSGKRIFLPASDLSKRYWMVNRDYDWSDFWHPIDDYGTWAYDKIPCLEIKKNNDSTAYHGSAEFYQPGYARGILEYSNEIKSGKTYDHSMMLLRHVDEREHGKEDFSINGILRSVRPWPLAGTTVQVDEAGFIFGTDSLSLYYDPNDASKNREWVDTMFVSGDTFRPVDGNHLKLSAGAKQISAYETKDIQVVLSGKNFLGYLDKNQKYYVREYFRIGDDYYYASKASPVKGYFPHTDPIRWFVGDETATFNGHLVGVSSEVVGDVGFIVSDSILNENEYAEPTLSTGKFYKAEVQPDMTFSITLPAENRYYFVRAVFASITENDTTVLYAPAEENRILHPLEIIDLGLEYKWANLDVRGQYPEVLDSTYVWEYPGNPLITDIGGTVHDVTFRKWFGRDGWLFTMPTTDQLKSLSDSCEFTPITRFGENVLKVTGVNGNVMYLPTYLSGWYWYAPFWSSQRPWTSKTEAYYYDFRKGKGERLMLHNMGYETRVRPVLQTNFSLDDGSPMFISTDTVGLSADHSHVQLYGRVLGITPQMRETYSGSITQGFLLHDFKGGKIGDVPCAEMPNDTVVNGLYDVIIPQEVIDTMDSNKDYWYRAYIKVGNKYYYGKPKKLSPLTITIDKIDWEVHENEATPYCSLVGTVFINDKNSAEIGFVVGDSANIDLGNNERKIIVNLANPTDELYDTQYSVPMPVDVDTVYWVKAYIIADGKTRYSDPRQFGLDYVDLGLTSKSLWANISVGGAYPEDNADFFAPGESFAKEHFNWDTYIDDYYKTINNTTIQSTDSLMLKSLSCKSNHGTTYEIPYRGAQKEIFHCEDPQYWVHYSGTKNDAAYMNWGKDNPKFENTQKYIPNNKYGDLFVEPNYKEWRELRNECAWTFTSENGVFGWKVTGRNGNFIFLPLLGYRYSSYSDYYKRWTDNLNNYPSNGYYHVADSAIVATMDTRNLFSTSNWVSTDQNPFNTTLLVAGMNVRPIARYNLPLTNKSKNGGKLRDDTLVYLNSDSVYYLNLRTAVALQGSYRINYPMASDQYDLGFVVGERDDVDINNKLFSTGVNLRNGSQYFIVLDKDDNLESDKTYYYRFFLHTKKDNKYYYSTDAQTFHLGRHQTKDVEWQMYSTKATIHGLVEGVMPAEAASPGFKAGLIVGYDRDNLTVENNIQDFDCTSQLNDLHVGPIQAEYTLTKDSTYFFRTYVYYNGTYHYGLLNMFGYELVDLGLPSGKKWASINFGGANALTGMRNPSIVTPGTIPDRSHTYWHNVNRLPYTYEAKELINNCTWTPDTIYGIAGYWVTSNINGKRIFMRNSYYYYHWEDQVAYILSGSYNDYYLIKPLNGGNAYCGTVYHTYDDCRGYNLLRPIWESNIKLDNEHQDELLIRTDDAKINDDISNVTFYGSFLGAYQQRLGTDMYVVPNIDHVGFVVGTDTLTTHDNEFFKLDFPKSNLRTDSIRFNETENINYFKVDSAYWVRAYVKIGDDYYYGRSIKFTRQPNIVTGDVVWAVGKQEARLKGKVTGFNDVFTLAGADESAEVQEMEELSKNARVGIIVGYVDDLTDKSPKHEIDSIYDLGMAKNGEFSILVPYKKDTTYYYRAFIYYNNEYVFGTYTNHYGLEFVDLGLPMQWASISVGSRFAEDACYRYAWGDTISHYPYTFNNYIFYNETGDDEYNNLGNEIKGSLNDVAHVKWNYTWDEAEFGGRGSLWAMPSEEDLQMLVDSCLWTDSISHGLDNSPVSGYKVTGHNGNSIFINKNKIEAWTISGHHDYTGPWESGPLWTSSRAPRDRNAFGMEAGRSNHLMKYHYRYHGHYVRPMAYINVNLPNGKKLSITTERTSWVAGDSVATIYGCILGLNTVTAEAYGFVVGNSKNNLVVGGANVTNHVCATNTQQLGLFSTTLRNLNNNRMYYFRAYVKINGKYYYGNTKDFGIVMVDLGLPSGTKWANVNMGSWKPKDHGNYYAWGETSSKDQFSREGYKYWDGKKQYYRDLGTNISGNDTTDVANKFLGGLWRMPGDEEWQELITECNWTVDTMAYIPGYRVSSKTNGNSIFLPSNYYTPSERDANYDLGTNEDGFLNHDNEVTHRGYYWSSNRSSDYRMGREVLFVDSAANSMMGRIMDNYRYRGNSIRAVAQPNRWDEVNKDSFYLRTENTNWRYQKDTVQFSSVVLNMPYKGKYKTGFFIGRSAELTSTNADTIIWAKPTEIGSGDYYAVLPDNKYNDGVFYYRAFIVDSTQISNPNRYLKADSRQFGLTSVDLGVEGLMWANINVDAASPEDIGLNGIPTGKYAGADPANVEFGSLWRTPTGLEKQRLLDECDWTQNDANGRPITLYGTPVWKVTNRNNPDNFIYLTTNNPDEWGYRAIAQFNVTFEDNNKIFLRTDSTNWRAGYDANTLYATLVGAPESLSGIQERGFLVNNNAELPTDNTQAPAGLLPADNVRTTDYMASLENLGIGKYYYRAYVKYDNKYYYAEEAKPLGVVFVDLGLPSGVKWANMNIGSTYDSDKGDKFAWGETTVKDTYTKANYNHYNSLGYADIGADISSSLYDAASYHINGTRMPSKDEISELIANCSWERATVNGVDGFRVTSLQVGNTNSIFLPIGNYWSSTQVASDNSKASILTENTNGSNNHVVSSALRELGNMVRPVSSMITTSGVANVTTNFANLSGIVNLSSYENTKVGFEIARSSDMNDKVELVNENVSSDGVYTYPADNLAEGTMYYYRAFVAITNDNNVTTRHYGTIKNFTTKSSVADRPNAIDLGLSVKWADRNVGANLPEAMGKYYAWGDTLTQRSYTQTTYPHHTNGEYHNIGNDISATTWDVANRKFHGCWRMPTQAEIQELINNCTWTWANKEGVQGYWVYNAATHQNIFLPAAGYYVRNEMTRKDTYGYYWSATTSTPSDAYAGALLFTSSSKSVGQGSGYGARELGFTIRPVYQSNAKLGEKDIYIRTDAVNNYNDDRTTNRLEGTMLGLNDVSDNLTQGFVIGTTEGVSLQSSTITVSQRATANGAYSITLTDEQLRQLTVGDVYYVCAFVSDGVNTQYGDPKVMTDYTFFTDSVQWSLSNEGKLYGHVKGQKAASGLEVGFRYATNSNMTGSKTVVAHFDEEHPEVFIGTIDTVKVATYYYQAYTKYEGEVHYGVVKSFGAQEVDLGLTSGIKWLNMNLGADHEEKAGDTYRWGETAPNQTGAYNVSADRTYIGGTAYDAAHTRLGKNYRLPSIANIQELLDECDWVWDVNGYRVKSRKNSNSIFLPLGSYWSSQQGAGTSSDATSLKLHDSNTKTPDALELRTDALMLRATRNSKADIEGEGGNAGGGEIGGGVEGDE